MSSRIFKIAYNNCYGGFSLSEKATKRFNELKGLSPNDEKYINPEYGYIDTFFERYDKDLIQVIEEFGEEASGNYSDIKIKEIKIPLFRITEYDGLETVETPDSMYWEKVDTPEARKKFPEYFL